MPQYPKGGREEEGDYQNDRPRTSDGRVRLRSLDEIDMRTAAGRAAKALIAALERDIGGGADLSAAQAALCRRAAMADALAADAETRWLEGSKIDIQEWASVARLQLLTLQALGLRRVPRNVTPNGNGNLTGRITNALRGIT